MIPFFKDLFEEAWGISRLPEHKQDAKSICDDIYHASLFDPNSYSSRSGKDSRAIVYLLEHEPRCNEKIDLSESKLFFSEAKSGNVLAASAMLPSSVNEAQRARRLNPALVTATLNGDVAMMRMLLSRGADPNVFDSQYHPLLLKIFDSKTLAREQKLQLAEILLTHGVDPNKPDLWGYSLFHKVSAGSDAGIIFLMLKYGAEINEGVACNTCSDKGKEPIHFAKNLQVAEKLIEAGADVNSTLRFGTTVLHHINDPALAKLFIENGANVNALHSAGWTPLMHCLQNHELMRGNTKHADKYQKIAKLLVRNGAKLELENGWDKNAFYYTSDEKLKEELVMLYMSAGESK